MGYPIEIANAMPRRPEVPLRHPLTGWWARFQDWRRRRRRRHRADHPRRYGQGVSPAWPPIPPGAAAQLDVPAIERHLASTRPPPTPRGRT